MALKVLRAKARYRSVSDQIFYNGNGGRIDGGNLRRSFYSSVKQAKIGHFRFHDLRHTFATRLVQAGVDIYTVQKFGRWRNISMVMRYAHHYPESLRSGVEALDKIRKKVSTNLTQFNKKGITGPFKISVTPLFCWCRDPELNFGHADFQSALPVAPVSVLWQRLASCQALTGRSGSVGMKLAASSPANLGLRLDSSVNLRILLLGLRST
jgi:hypothetical protein